MSRDSRRIINTSNRLRDAMRPWLLASEAAGGPSDEAFSRFLQVALPHLLADDPRDRRIDRSRTRSPWKRPGMTKSQEFRAMLWRSAEGDTERYMDE